MPRLETGATRSLDNPKHVYIVKSANYFANTDLRGKDLRNKCCVGYILSYSSPNPNIQYHSRAAQMSLPSVAQGNAPKKILNQEFLV